MGRRGLRWHLVFGFRAPAGELEVPALGALVDMLMNGKANAIELVAESLHHAATPRTDHERLLSK